jgi:ferrochelatase
VAKQAVLLLAHGTPETIEQIPEYLRNVVSGRPLPQAVVEEIQHRYAQIGHSPLTEITFAQARLVEAELAAAGQAVPVYVGMRNWRPYIPEVVRQMRADGIEEAAVICMAPQNSRTSVGLYRRAVEAEAGDLRIDFTPGWAQHPLLADAFAERLRPALAKLTKEVGGPVPVLFTAHSVPTRTVEAPAADADAGKRMWPGQGVDPYAEEARHTAELVAARVPEIPRWWFAFQSVAGAERGGDARPDCGRGREGADSATHRISLRPCGDFVRRGHPFSRVRHKKTRSAQAPGIAQCFRNTGEGGCGSGARWIGTVGHAHVSSIERRRMLEMMHRVGSS